jgi:preprotein translocase subunit SecY
LKLPAVVLNNKVIDVAKTSKVSTPSKFAELKRRIFFLIGALVVYRLGAHIPIPGINPIELAAQFSDLRSGVLGMLDMFSGGALSNLTIFALGIMPYISASIIIQLASEMLPSLKELKKEGESGRRKITRYTRYGTVLLACIQSFALAATLFKQPNLVVTDMFSFYITTVVSLVTGTMFLMWLGEQITERGIGNGISLIICAGIASGIPTAIGQTLAQVSAGTMSSVLVVFLFLGLILATFVVVFVERGQRKILINYANRQAGSRLIKSPSSFLPLKVNMAGVIPPIFASSIILFPATILNFVGASNGFGWIKSIADMMQRGQATYLLLYATAIIFFCYFYTALMFSPKEMAENLKKQGAFVPGIRPGEQTSRYIEKVSLRLILIGAIYIMTVCLIPELMHANWSNLPFSFGGTSLLIIVVVSMDLMEQIQTQAMSHQYESLLKKANFSGNSLAR